ncbi:hypothetical protein ABZ328_20650 [Micromonospora aurantiaca]
MLLTYVDESYTDRWYWIGALLVPEAVAIPLSTALDEVMTDAATAYGTDRAAELHGYDLFQGRMAWARVPPRARIAVYNAALKAIGTYDVTVICAASTGTASPGATGSPAPLTRWCCHTFWNGWTDTRRCGTNWPW